MNWQEGNLKPNNYGFELVQEGEISELKTRARLWRHIKTGARLLSLENEDENKVFGITFRTPPSDSTGIAHIMEHSVLCGSRKYPLKEPFVELIKSSVNTYLNASTYPDKTCYPVASQNLQDFYNLIDVYLDAVFYPLLNPYTLDQEGWHYELEHPEDPLAFKGVVFNEMKGNYSSPDMVLYEQSQQLLFPDNTYGLDSGGNPQVIPDLTYAQFKTFHDTYYHPSNAYIYFYGDDDPQERLRLLSEYLDGFEPNQARSEVPLQPRFEAPRRFTVPYEAGEDGDGRKAQLTVNWLLPEAASLETFLSYSLLAHVLLGTPASPLRRALLESGLGEDLAGVGLEPDLRQLYFSTGLKGFPPEKAGQVEALILDTLEKLVEAGLDPETVAASMNTLEFRYRENNTGSAPRGLSIMLRALRSWLHGGDPLAAVAFEEPLQVLKSRLEADKRYLENLLRREFLENPHRTTVILEPDPEVGARREAAERDRLEIARAGMSAADLQAVIEKTQELKRRQVAPDPPEALATIPRLKLEDLDREIKRIPCDLLKKHDLRLLYHDLFTNGIVYLDLGFNLRSLPQELLPYVPLFGRALLELGTEEEDFVRLSQRIGRNTGGIWPATFTSRVQEDGSTAAWLFLRGKALASQAGALLSILSDVLIKVRLDNQERFRQFVLEDKAGAEAGLIPGGHRVINSRLRSLFDEAAWASEQMGGISHLLFLRGLAEKVDKDWPAVLSRLEQVRQILINRENMIGNVTLDAANWKAFEPQLSGFVAGLPADPVKAQEWQPEPRPRHEGLALPAQVNYVGKGADLYSFGYRQHGSLSVINNFLQTTYLWERVRVQGGAYGAFTVFDHRSGVYTLISYRDPNLGGTLEAYDQMAGFLQGLQDERLSREELEKTIIGTIGELDAYQLPDAKGYTSLLRYLAGDSDESRQKRRDEIFAASLEDFHRFGEVLEAVRDAGRVIVLGSQEALQELNSGRQEPLEIRKLL
jgi:Zn-dependent M16 (insulinase) family peptidase